MIEKGRKTPVFTNGGPQAKVGPRAPISADPRRRDGGGPTSDYDREKQERLQSWPAGRFGG